MVKAFVAMLLLQRIQAAGEDCHLVPSGSEWIMGGEVHSNRNTLLNSRNRLHISFCQYILQQSLGAIKMHVILNQSDEHNHFIRRVLRVLVKCISMHNPPFEILFDLWTGIFFLDYVPFCHSVDFTPTTNTATMVEPANGDLWRNYFVYSDRAGLILNEVGLVSSACLSGPEPRQPRQGWDRQGVDTLTNWTTGQKCPASCSHPAQFVIYNSRGKHAGRQLFLQQLRGQSNIVICLFLQQCNCSEKNNFKRNFHNVSPRLWPFSSLVPSNRAGRAKGPRASGLKDFAPPHHHRPQPMSSKTTGEGCGRTK